MKSEERRKERTKRDQERERWTLFYTFAGLQRDEQGGSE